MSMAPSNLFYPVRTQIFGGLDPRLPNRVYTLVELAPFLVPCSKTDQKLVQFDLSFALIEPAPFLVPG